ncbi:MAG: hypothetical protein JWO72_2093 [Caulobacteraceae bacterium]|jgi:uncharacterized protein (DUF983 family)|nr:hypothetical protein [Caulobacteraceae bacterium]
MSAGVNPVLAGIACRCPNCGEGPLFSGFLTVTDRCDSCGLDLRAADSGDGPAVFIILIVGVLMGFSALVAEVAFHPPVWLHLVVWLPLTLILCLALLRPFKGVMLAMQFHNKASEAGRRDV